MKNYFTTENLYKATLITLVFIYLFTSLAILNNFNPIF